MRRTGRLFVAACLLLPSVAFAARPTPYEYVAQGDPSGSLELVGHDALGNRGENAALAVHGDYAYVGARTDPKVPQVVQDGVLVVDVSKPDSPEVVSEIGPPNEGNQGETSREMRVWQSQDVLIVMNLFSNCAEIHACTPVGGDDNFRFYDISGKNGANPKLISEYVPSINPHEFFLWEDPKDPKRALLFMSTPGGGQQMLVTDISDLRKNKFTELGGASFPVGQSGNDNRLHSYGMSPDGTRAYLAYLEAGFFVLDTSDFAKGVKKPKVRLLTPPDNAPSWPETEGPGAHSAVPMFGSPYVLVTDEVYGEALRPLDSGGCPWGWVRMLDIHSEAKPKIVSEYKLPYNQEDFCTTDPPRPFSSYSAHNPTLTQHLAFVTWHSGGLQVIDISDPKKPSQAAEFVPDPELYALQEDPVLSSGQDKVVMWSYPIIQDGLIYVVDIRNGLYILKYKGPFASEVSKIKFLEGNSNAGDALRLGRL